MFRHLSRTARLLPGILVQPQLPAKAYFPISHRLLASKSPENVNKGVSKDESNADTKESLKSAVHNKVCDELVKHNKVVVFMKGTPKSPRCGFSNAVVQIFRMHNVDYAAHDVLADNELREGIKAYTDWPTIPQVFIDGEFVGGCDILLEMHQNGELVETLKKAGIESELVKIERDVAKKLEDEKRQKSKKR